ncbi:hypothetical protein RRF57_000104 [Xylaria bambusicola]|uniref:Uncharacterized protein n=1 Tax=Xylaria bambusicola TaxID=326684 RepID=A0AAN7U9M4_9PEZI
MCCGKTVSTLFELNTAQSPSHPFPPIRSKSPFARKGQSRAQNGAAYYLEPLEFTEADMHAVFRCEEQFLKRGENEYPSPPTAPLYWDGSPPCNMANHKVIDCGI